ncbi:MAG: tryptophan synthase subunit alpha [Clostridiales bacterium]|jgi:tryptophan synthase alpha chain|nr:tryptophan synthase subunit alpha [Clostridiales bacterium]
MSRIRGAFARGKAFIGFVTGGDPSVAASERFIRELIRAGADLVEIGVPFSDPIAEGEVIQRANGRALAAGVTLDALFGLVLRLRRDFDTPLVFLTYLNPVFRYGYRAFFERCRESGADGVIIPDLPYEESFEVKRAARLFGVDLISLVAPTSAERVRKIARDADGFLYIVSSMGVTGVRSEITTDVVAIASAAREVSDVPRAVGFGIGTPERAREMSAMADGVIVGSAIVRVIERRGEDAAADVYAFARKIREAIDEG